MLLEFLIDRASLFYYVAIGKHRNQNIWIYTRSQQQLKYIDRNLRKTQTALRYFEFSVCSSLLNDDKGRVDTLYINAYVGIAR